MTTSNYNTRLDQELKNKDFSVFESYGLTPSQSIKLFLSQVAETNSVPLSFDYHSKPGNSALQVLAELDSSYHTESILED
jgi:DNA-damage-inducible protein J/RHH-type rel operon transcriptional repressor/antitoxin RelB